MFNLIEVHGRPVQRFPLNSSTPGTLTCRRPGYLDGSRRFCPTSTELAPASLKYAFQKSVTFCCSATPSGRRSLVPPSQFVGWGICHWHPSLAQLEQRLNGGVARPAAGAEPNIGDNFVFLIFAVLRYAFVAEK